MERDKSCFVSNYHDLENLFYHPAKNVKSILLLPSVDMVQVDYEKLEDFRPVNRKTNVVIGSFITSNARIFMHRAFQQIARCGGHIHYTGNSE